MEDAKSREQFLAERSRGLGGSDAAAALGLDPWRTKLQLWAEKRNALQAPPKLTRRDHLRLRMGHRMEEVIAAEFTDQTGRKVRRKRAAVFDKQQDFLLVHIDRQQWLAEREVVELPNYDLPTMTKAGVLEIKSPNQFMAPEWDEDEAKAPLHYEVQMQHSLMVTGAPWGGFCVLIGKDQFVMFDVRRNERFIEKLRAALADFWDMVLTGKKPEVTESDKAVLSQLYPDADGGVVTLPPEFSDVDLELRAAKEARKNAQSTIDLCENKIRDQIGDKTFGMLEDGSGYFSWKNQSRKEVVQKAATFRVLRRHKGGLR